MFFGGGFPGFGGGDPFGGGGMPGGRGGEGKEVDTETYYKLLGVEKNASVRAHVPIGLCRLAPDAPPAQRASPLRPRQRACSAVPSLPARA